MNKKGAELTIGTIIIIVLGVVVLALLVWGFSTGWSNLWGKISSWGGGSNVDTIKQACALECNGGQHTAYCTDQKTLITGDKTKYFGTCHGFEKNAKIQPMSVASCNGDNFCTAANGVAVPNTKVTGADGKDVV